MNEEEYWNEEEIKRLNKVVDKLEQRISTLEKVIGKLQLRLGDVVLYIDKREDKNELERSNN
jgi:hypothetical protein